MKQTCGILAFIAAAFLSAVPAWARIKLTALPARDRVEIQLDNGRYTLVEEERIIPLLKSTFKTGNNKIDFSWSNTHIDKNSIRFRAIAVMDSGKARPIRTAGGQAEVAVINVSYPPDENALVWEVFAAEGCAVKVRVSYLINNLTRTFHYTAVTNRAETEMELREYIQLRNYSGEGFGSTGVVLGYADRLLKPGAVGQQEDVKMLLYRFHKVPILKTYTFDWHRFGRLDKDRPNASKVVMHYEVMNDRKGGLGGVPLEPGKVRIYLRDGRGGQAFLGEDWGKLTPIGSKMRLYVGQARDVVCKRMVEFKEVQQVRGNLVDIQVRLRYEIENFKPHPVRLDIVEQLNSLADRFHAGWRHGEVEWEVGPRTTKPLRITRDFGGASPVLHVDLPARTDQPVKTVVTFQFTLKNLWK